MSRQTSLLIHGAYILSMDEQMRVLPRGDILIEGETISKIGESINPPPHATVIEGRGRMAIPGLINAHMHSDETLFRGLLDRMPLEVWMLYSLPPFLYGSVSSRLTYLRTLIGALELLHSGVTTIQDDVSESPRPSLEGTEAVLQAYLDSGIRANVACNMTDKPYHRKLPYIESILPAWALYEAQSIPVPDAKDLLQLVQAIHREWDGRNGRLRVALSASAPQRCTEEFICALDELSQSWNAPLLTHVLETKVQVVTGDEFYSKTIIDHLRSLGVLSDRLTIAHGIWVTDEDIERLAESEVAVAHNPISNLKLGSGLMPLAKYLSVGVPVCLGTDGSSSNDSFNMFEVMKFAALLHRIASPIVETWPTAQAILKMALHYGARSTLLQSEIGSLEIGKKADIVLLRMSSPAFVPLNDPYNHLVFCENGRDVETVIVDGRIVVENGKVTTVKALEVYEEMVSLMEPFMRDLRPSYAKSRLLEPSVWAMYERCQRTDVGLNRFATPPNAWTW